MSARPNSRRAAECAGQNGPHPVLPPGDNLSRKSRLAMSSTAAVRDAARVCSRKAQMFSMGHTSMSSSSRFSSSRSWAVSFSSLKRRPPACPPSPGTPAPAGPAAPRRRRTPGPPRPVAMGDFPLVNVHQALGLHPGQVGEHRVAAPAGGGTQGLHRRPQGSPSGTAHRASSTRHSFSLSFMANPPTAVVSICILQL